MRGDIGLCGNLGRIQPAIKQAGFNLYFFSSVYVCDSEELLPSSDASEEALDSDSSDCDV